MNVSLEDGESNDLPSTSNDGTGQQSTLRFSIKENNRPREARNMHKDEHQHGSTQGRSRHGSVFDEEYEREHYTRNPQSRKSSSSYAAPTNASQARKSEKVEIPSHPSSDRQRAFSTLGSLRASPIQRSSNVFNDFQGASPISDHLPQLPWEQKEGTRQTRCCSPDPMDSRAVGSHNDEYVAKMLRNWEQMKQEAEEWPGRGEEGDLEKEGLKKQLEELATERDETLRIRAHLQRELALAKNEIANLRQRSSDLEAETGEKDTVACIERDERADIELRVHEISAENWKRKHDRLYLINRELEEKIEARNRLESGLLMERVQSENKTLLTTVAERQRELRKTQRELEKITEYAQEKDIEILENNKRLGAFQAFISDMSEAMTKLAQVSCHEPRVELSDIESLIEDCAEDTGTKVLLVNTRQLLVNLVHKRELLESQLEDKTYEIENMKKRMEVRIGEIEDAVQSPSFASSDILTPGLPSSGFMSPGFATAGFMRPPVSLQDDREGFEGLYEEELEKRKAAEKKIQDVSAARKQQLRHQQARKELESRLRKVLEENEVLRKEAGEAKLQANLWKDESEQSKLELDKRITEFQSCIDQNEQEKDQYIKYYYNEIQDESRWEAASLHKKLEDQEQEYKTLKREFDRSKATNARRQGEIASLEKKYMMQSKHIRDVERAILHNEELPALPNLDDEDEPQYGSELGTFSCASPLTPSTHAAPTADRRPKPRYEQSNVAAARIAKVETYRAQLRAKTEEEMRNFIFDAPPTIMRKEKAVDDIIEKVRQWSFAETYPPNKDDWRDLRDRSMWERWGGEKWAAQCKEKRFLDILRKREILEDH